VPDEHALVVSLHKLGAVKRGGSPDDVMETYIMQRTQISLTAEERRALDAEAARTGRSISALIRDAVEAHYGTARSADEDLDGMRRAFGAWKGRRTDGKTWVDQRRSGSRLDRDDS
jgi:hypothetical protein